MPITFLDPMYLALILLLVPVLAVWYKRQRAVSHSRVGMHANLKNFSLLSKLPMIFFALAFTLMCIGRAQPVLTHVTEHQTIETRDIVVATDISGSMNEKINSTKAGAEPGWCLKYGCVVAAPDGKVDATTQPAKLDLARQAVKYFVTQRKGDRIALMAFDDATYFMWPLSSDQDVLTQRTDLLNKTGGGTNFDGPAADAAAPGPIQSAIDHFKQYSTAKTKIFIMVTDGGSTISPDRMAYLTKEMEKLGVHMYVLGVGDDWTSGDASTNDLRNFVGALHGSIVNVGSASELQAAIEQINKTEKSSVQLQREVAYHDIYFPFLLASLLCWMLFLLFNAATRRTS